MADVFDGVRIEDQAGRPVDIAFLRQRFGRFLTATWDRTKWTLEKIYLPEGAMTCWISLVTADGNPIVDFPVQWGWPDGSVPSPTDNAGRSNWIIGNDIWIDGAGNIANRVKGPYFADGDGFHVEGIGWAGGTNHQKPCLYFRKAGGGSGPPAPGIDTPAIRAHLDAAMAELAAARALLP